MIKIMTLNINYYGSNHGPWSTRREIIQEVIQATDPDIIALQAVRKDPGVEQGQDQANQLAERIPGYSYVIFQPAMIYPDGGAEGSALLSKIPWSNTEYRALTRLPDGEDPNQRVVLMAKFERDGGPFHLFTGHFSWVREQGWRNIREVMPYFHSVTGKAMLVGDLNITPESDLFDPLRSAGWVDVWAEKEPDDPGYTFLESDRLTKRIDYAWVNPALAANIQGIRIVADQPLDRGERASDHAGLLVSLNV